MKKILNSNFTFIDLFAGIGGFRIAMENYSKGKAKCLFASEIDVSAAQTYELNFKQKPLGDIRTINPMESDLDCPDVVCGGFPCQTFSKGGNQAGFKDSRGTLFREIIRIIQSFKKSKPKILLLENVQNLISHDGGDTWKVIYKEITDAGYNVISKPLVISPKDVGVPQLRNRAIILAVRKDIYSGDIDIAIPKAKQNSLRFSSIIEENADAKYKISKDQINILKCWNEFIHIIPKKDRVIGFPIWSDEFGRDYSIKHYPLWKQLFINKNRELYKKYKTKIDSWMKKWDIRNQFTPTNRKFEWQAGKDMDSVFEGIIQFRTSGVRVKRPTESPALVAMDHRPIIGSELRYITPIEALRLQSFPDNYLFQENEKQIYKQLGNAVNVKVIQTAFETFIRYLEEKAED